MGVVRMAGAFLFLYILAKIVFMVSHKLFSGTGPTFSLLSDGARPWFMLCMAMWGPVAHATRRIDLVPLLSIWVVLALAVGYDSEVGNWLCLSRAIVFFPFYLVGFRMDPSKVYEFLSYKKWLLIGSITLAVIAVGFTVFEGYLYPYKLLENACYPYSAVWADGCGAAERFVWYILAAIAVAALVAVFVHVKSHYLAWFGRRSLAIYVFHLPFTLLFVKIGVVEMIQRLPFSGIAVLLLSICISLLSGLKPFCQFTFTFQRVFSGRASESNA